MTKINRNRNPILINNTPTITTKPLLIQLIEPRLRIRLRKTLPTTLTFIRTMPNRRAAIRMQRIESNERGIIAVYIGAVAIVILRDRRFARAVAYERATGLAAAVVFQDGRESGLDFR